MTIFELVFLTANKALWAKDLGNFKKLISKIHSYILFKFIVLKKCPSVYATHTHGHPYFFQIERIFCKILEAYWASFKASSTKFRKICSFFGFD